MGILLIGNGQDVGVGVGGTGVAQGFLVIAGVGVIGVAHAVLVAAKSDPVNIVIEGFKFRIGSNVPSTVLVAVGVEVLV